MRHAWKFAIVAGVALVVANFITVSHSSYTCVLCRSYRFDWKCLGVVIPSYAETDCSRWYAAHVEPSHAHLWERGTCVSETNLLGRPLRMDAAQVGSQSGGSIPTLNSPSTSISRSPSRPRRSSPTSPTRRPTRTGSKRISGPKAT